MSRQDSPYIVGDYWLDKRRDDRSPYWQITSAERGSFAYRSTRKLDLEEAKAALDAFVARQKSKERSEPTEAMAAVHLISYWTERGTKLINADQTQRSLYTFIAFLLQDEAGGRAMVSDLTPSLFERFRVWRMGPHQFEIEWFGKVRTYGSAGVSGATVQRNINDVRAAIHHAEANMRVTAVPKIKDIEARYRSPHKDRILTEDELARIVWYAYHNPSLFRFVALQMATSVRPMAALKFDPRRQYDDRRGLIDLQPDEAPQTKKRNAIIPAIRPLRPVLRAWAAEGFEPVTSHKTAWRIMRRVLRLSEDVQPKTIRYTVATWLYEMEWVPERQISEMLGHTSDDNRGLARTSRIYAKYRPERMGLVVKALTIIWCRISLLARQYATVHSLSTGQRGDPFEVREVEKKSPKSVV